MYQYAHVCKRSCGLCDLLPTTSAECRFSRDVLGEWLLAEVDGLQKVTVTTGLVTMSQLGEFVCKGKHWSANDYKLLSYYSNGCRPRYSCLKLERHSEDTLQMQLSHSSLDDNSFELCHFADDPSPLADRIHSAQPKILLPWRKLKSGTCGLHGTVHVSNIARSTLDSSSLDSSVMDSSTLDRSTTAAACHGSMSDWNSELCRGHSQLWLSLAGHCLTAHNRSIYRQGFNCVSYMLFSDSFSLLWTNSNSKHGRQLFCWVIKLQHGERGPAWSEVYMMNRAQCGFDRDLDIVYLRSTALLSLAVASESVDKRCAMTTKRPPRRQVTGRETAPWSTSCQRC